MKIFTEMKNKEKKRSIICMRPYKILNSQSNFEKKKKRAVDFTLLFLPNYKTLVIRTVWYWYQNRHIDQGSKTESIEINSCIHSWLTLNKEFKNTQWEGQSLQQMVVVVSCVQLFWEAHQAPLSMGIPRQEYWNGLPFLLQGNLPDPEIKHVSSATPTSAGRFFATREALFKIGWWLNWIAVWNG